MNNKKKTGGLSKIRKLITVLEKCNGKDTIGGKDALISPKAAKILIIVGLIFLTGALFAVFFLVEPFIAPFIPIKDITQAIMLIILIMSFVLSVKNIVTVLYTADDLPVLLPMPLSAGQIVTAKLTVASRFSVGLSLIVTNSVCLGLGVRAGMGAAYVIGTMLSSALIPITGIALATLLIVTVFKIFGFIRNRDITVVLGGIFTLALTVTYMFISNKFNNGDSNSVAAIFSTISSIASGFPNIAYMTNFMFNDNIVGLIVSVGITAAVTALAMLAVKLFYIVTALSMQTTGTKNKTIKKDSLSHDKSNALKALTSYEAKSTRRNPAYMIYGFAMSFIWPVLIILPIVLGQNSFINNFKSPLDLTTALISALTFGITASCFACGFNILPLSAFSREGNSFSTLQSMPIEFKDYYKSKRNFSLLICSLGSVLYITILGIVCVAMGILSIKNSWVIIYGAGISFLLNLILINSMLLKNSRKPYFTWDSETEISRKLSWINIVSLIIGFIAFITFFITLAFSSLTNSPENPLNSKMIQVMTAITAAVVGVIILILAFAINRLSVKKAEENLMRFE